MPVCLSAVPSLSLADALHASHLIKSAALKPLVTYSTSAFVKTFADPKSDISSLLCQRGMISSQSDNARFLILMRLQVIPLSPVWANLLLQSG